MKRWQPLQFLVLPAATLAGAAWGGWWYYLAPGLVFIVRPLLTLTIPPRESSSVSQNRYPHNKSYHWLLLLYVPVISSLNLWALHHAAIKQLLPYELAGLVLSVGIVNGVLGFTIAHELIHRHHPKEKLAGLLLLLQTNYLHYQVEHIAGHHVYACTNADPHTARRNESFYAFLPRAISGTWLNAWKLEAKRLQRMSFPILSVHNRIIRYSIIQLVVALIILLLAGWQVLLFFIAQSLVAIALLHLVNYLQHYGLLRTETTEGSLERVSAHHAWNAKKGADDIGLFQLENHADHHMHPNLSYELLSVHASSPQHPTGYTGMMWLALIPPLYFTIMNRRIPE